MAQPDAIAQLLLLEPPTDGRPAGWRPLDEAMRARDACVALGYAAVVSEIVEFMNAMLDEAAPLSAMAHATPPYDHPRLGGPYEGTVCLIDTPGVSEPRGHQPHVWSGMITARPASRRDAATMGRVDAAATNVDGPYRARQSSNRGRDRCRW